MNLAEMTPRGDLSSTRYCLAAPGLEYLVYQPESEEFVINLEGSAEKRFSVEWFEPETGAKLQDQLSREEPASPSRRLLMPNQYYI